MKRSSKEINRDFQQAEGPKGGSAGFFPLKQLFCFARNSLITSLLTIAPGNGKTCSSLLPSQELWWEKTRIRVNFQKTGEQGKCSPCLMGIWKSWNKTNRGFKWYMGPVLALYVWEIFSLLEKWSAFKSTNEELKLWWMQKAQIPQEFRERKSHTWLNPPQTHKRCKVNYLFTLNSRINGTNLQQIQAKNRLKLSWFTTAKDVSQEWIF